MNLNRNKTKFMSKNQWVANIKDFLVFNQIIIKNNQVLRSQNQKFQGNQLLFWNKNQLTSLMMNLIKKIIRISIKRAIKNREYQITKICHLWRWKNPVTSKRINYHHSLQGNSLRNNKNLPLFSTKMNRWCLDKCHLIQIWAFKAGLRDTQENNSINSQDKAKKNLHHNRKIIRKSLICWIIHKGIPVRRKNCQKSRKIKEYRSSWIVQEEILVMFRKNSLKIQI